MGAPQHVVLIGCGFTGTSAFFQLVDRYPVREITIFESSGRFGPGYPYRPDECEDYLINNTTDTMRVVPSNPRAFADWLFTRPDLVPQVDEKGHLPRAYFGVFLEEVFRATRTSAVVKGIRVNLIPAEATAMYEDQVGQVHVSWETGKVTGDIAILTTGRCPDISPVEDHHDTSVVYIPNHVGSSAISQLPLDADIHVLGASLSAYDVVNRLFSPQTGCEFREDAGGELAFDPGPNGRRVLLYSRSGRLKKMQSRSPAKLELKEFTIEKLRAKGGGHGLSLEDIGKLICDEARVQGAEIDWISVLDPYAECDSASKVNERAGKILTADIEAAKAGSPANFLVDFFSSAYVGIWDAWAEGLLRPSEELRYRTHWETAALCYVAPCPVPTAERLRALHRAGRLLVFRGVRDVHLASDGSHYLVSHDFGEERAKVLINATGRVDRQLPSSRQPRLVTSLREAGYLRPYNRAGTIGNGVAVDMRSFRAEGSRNIYIANMLLWGPGFFTSSAFMMATIVERLLEHACS